MLEPFQIIVAVLSVLLVAVFLWLKGSNKKPFLDPEQWKELPLVEKEVLTHNTRRLRFQLPYPDQVLGLPTGQHITLKFITPEGEEVLRPYTPVTDDDTPGHVDFVIKVYPQGRMSVHLDKLKIGDTMLFKGPKGRFQYTPNMKGKIGMLAGGTGITPMYQVANAILKDQNDISKLYLIFANVNPDDILIQKELETLVKKYPYRFNVKYVLNNPPPNWSGGVGFVTSDMIKEFLPAPADDVMIVRCGPGPMNKAMAEHLNKLGYTKEMQFEF